MNPQQIAVLVVVATLGLLVLLLLVYGRPRRTRTEPAPANFSKGDQDSVLEGPRLHRILVWGVASSIFMTGFLAVYFVIEPFRQATYAEQFHDKSVERGEHEFLEITGANCASCHGPDGSGGFAATDTSWPAPPLNNIFHRYTRDEITRIVERGRPGTPMPAWSTEFGGALNNMQVDDVVNYLETIQVPEDERWELPEDLTDGREVFGRKCAVCHGENAEGAAMGEPLPTFYAPDLTTEFYRLGIKVMRVEVRDQLRAESEAGDPAPTAEEIEARLAQVPANEILAAGEEASRNTIVRGRENTPMPAWMNRMAEPQIDAVVEYLRSIQRIPEDAGA